jgi:signal transduction histidine kinase
MSSSTLPQLGSEETAALKGDRPALLYGLACLALLAALAIAMLPSAPAVLVILLALAGVAAALVQIVPPVVRLLWTRRSLLVVVLFALLAVVWLVVGLRGINNEWWPSYVQRFADGSPLRPPFFGFDDVLGETRWPWRVGAVPILPLLIAISSAGASLVLVADAVRIQTGLAGPPRSRWRSITQTPSRGGRVMVRVIPGLILIVTAAFLGMSFTSDHTDVQADPLLATIVMLAIGGAALLIVASPVAIGMAIRLNLDKAAAARDAERQRFAAHLHDSVLQTLALIQRQAHDPDAVSKLARRQEHALRAWMAGEAELTSATLSSAVRDVAAEVEDEYSITVELAAIGDTKLDGRGEELVAATREALRNAARHAPGAPVYVFLDIGASGAELFVRDNGPGFDFEAVPAERRGLRDAVIGRMAFAGGSATVESSLGEGTEVALKLPLDGRTR